ncbi:hypothetical protein HK101_005792 [Irineochytrium annulatum]|nr:hypothetical protein HK101_005792 [Irineochytrium annulatum]
MSPRYSDERLDPIDRDRDRERYRDQAPSERTRIDDDSKKKRRNDSDTDDERDSKRKKKKDKKRETSSERAARKALKKAEKKKLREELQQQNEAQVARQMAASLGYSSTENPFGDNLLHQKFIWVKKREAEVEKGMTAQERARLDARKKEETQMELEKLKRRRAEREIDMQLREQEQLRLQRERDQAALGDWETREDNFHLHQAKVRAQIRIKEGRAKPIDILAMNVSIATDTDIAKEFDAIGLEMDTDEPYKIFENLTLPEIEELYKDIQLYLALEHDAMNKSFWEAMIVVCDDELSRSRRALAGPRPSTSVEMEHEITAMLSGKTYAQLQTTQAQVERRLTGEDGPVDIEFWEAVLKALIVWKAKARLRDTHKFMITKRLEQLKAKAAEEAEEGG